MTSIVYFVVRERDGAIKIGTTNDMARRLAELVAESPCDLLATHAGSYRDESQLHDRFRASRIYVDNHLTEWFRPTDDLTDHIASIPKSEDTRKVSSPYVRPDYGCDLDDEDPPGDGMPF